jgi:DNA-binding GntR family transcriptional regulator
MAANLGRIRADDTLRQKSVEMLSNAILSSKIKPGERLNESELARKLHVSRAPIREALQQLQEQGLIVNVPRRGMFVVSLDEESIQKINSLRVVLEAEALRLARRNAGPKEREKLTHLIEKMEGMSGVPTNEMTRVDMEFHRMIWSFTRNEYLEKTLTSLTAPIFAHSMLTLLREEKQKMVLDSHRPLLEYVLGTSDEPAEKVMLNHLTLRWVDPARFSSLRDGLHPGSGSGPDKA